MHPCLVALLTALPALAADPAPVNPTNLGPVNTKADEDEPFVTADGRSLYYASNAAGKFDLLLTRRAGVPATWTPGKPLGDWLQTDVDDRGTFVTPDGRYPQTLFFATKLDKEQDTFDLYFVLRDGPRAAFSPRRPLNTVDTAADEMHPWLTADGKRLYFSRRTREGWRVFVVSRPGAAAGAGFGKPTPLDDLPAGFHHATLTRDDKTMFLQGPVGEGRWGLFRSRATATGWTKPEPLEGLSHPEGKVGDASPQVSSDGAVLHFASDRPGGKGGLDLYRIRVSDLKQ